MTMKTAWFPLIALVASFGTSCSKQGVVDVVELEERLTRLSENYQKLGKDIAQERQKAVRVESETRGLVEERLSVKEQLASMAVDASRIREDFVMYRREFLKAARMRAKGLKIPQIEFKGKVYTGVTVSDTSNGILSFTHSGGSSQVEMSDLDEELQMLVGYDSENPLEEEIKPSPEAVLAVAIEAGQKARDDVYAAREKKALKPKPEQPVTRSNNVTNRPAWMSRSSFEGPSMAPYGGQRRKVSRAN